MESACLVEEFVLACLYNTIVRYLLAGIHCIHVLNHTFAEAAIDYNTLPLAQCVKSAMMWCCSKLVLYFYLPADITKSRIIVCIGVCEM